jgi:hypothetical protein
LAEASLIFCGSSHSTAGAAMVNRLTEILFQSENAEHPCNAGDVDQFAMQGMERAMGIECNEIGL